MSNLSRQIGFKVLCTSLLIGCNGGESNQSFTVDCSNPTPLDAGESVSWSVESTNNEIQIVEMESKSTELFELKNGDGEKKQFTLVEDENGCKSFESGQEKNETEILITSEEPASALRILTHKYLYGDEASLNLPEGQDAPANTNKFQQTCELNSEGENACSGTYEVEDNVFHWNSVHRLPPDRPASGITYFEINQNDQVFFKLLLLDWNGL